MDPRAFRRLAIKHYAVQTIVGLAVGVPAWYVVYVLYPDVWLWPVLGWACILFAAGVAAHDIRRWWRSL